MNSSSNSLNNSASNNNNMNINAPSNKHPSPSERDDSLSTKEEDITKDDLQAMKDMIGDIKRDPSLLYRLSSLPGGGGDFATSNTATMGETTTYLHSNALHATDNSNSNNPINYNGANVGMITPSSANANSFNNSSMNLTLPNQR